MNTEYRCYICNVRKAKEELNVFVSDVRSPGTTHVMNKMQIHACSACESVANDSFVEPAFGFYAVFKITNGIVGSGNLLWTDELVKSAIPR